MNAPKNLAVSALIATTVALSGCASAYLQVESPNGVGTCDSVPVTLSVEQNDAGDQVEINYNGPTNASLLAYQGVYSDSSFWGLLETESFIFNYPLDDDTSPYDFAINALDIQPDPWTVTSTGPSTMSVVFDGSVNSLVDSFQYNAAESGEELAMFDKLLPVTIAVFCEADVPSVLVPDVTVDEDGAIDGFEVEIAQGLFPNFMYADAPTVTRQTAMNHGVRGRMVLPMEIIDALPEVVGDVQVSASLAFLGDSDPYGPVTEDQPFSLTDAELGDIWLLTLEATFVSDGSSPSFEITDSGSLADPMSFEFTGDTEPDDGYYLLMMTVSDDSDTPEHLKIASSVAYYSSERGLTLSGLDEPIDLENLAATGGDPNVIIWAVLGGLVVLAAVVLRPKRRKAQAESTIDPSARKE
jgi:hypothetical protein